MNLSEHKMDTSEQKATLSFQALDMATKRAFSDLLLEELADINECLNEHVDQLERRDFLSELIKFAGKGPAITLDSSRLGIPNVTQMSTTSRNALEHNYKKQCLGKKAEWICEVVEKLHSVAAKTGHLSRSSENCVKLLFLGLSDGGILREWCACYIASHQLGCESAIERLEESIQSLCMNHKMFLSLLETDNEASSESLLLGAIETCNAVRQHVRTESVDLRVAAQHYQHVYGSLGKNVGIGVARNAFRKALEFDFFCPCVRAEVIGGMRIPLDRDYDVIIHRESNFDSLLNADTWLPDLTEMSLTVFRPHHLEAIARAQECNLHAGQLSWSVSEAAVERSEQDFSEESATLRILLGVVSADRGEQPDFLIPREPIVQTERGPISIYKILKLGSQACECLHSASDSTRDEVGATLTSLAKRDSERLIDSGIYSLVRAGLFSLLDEIEVSVPPPSESRAGTELLRFLVGSDSRELFGEVAFVVAELRAMEKRGDSQLGSIFQFCLPTLFEKNNAGNYLFALSFRLFLRSRLAAFLRMERTLYITTGINYIDSICERLTRERIGEVLGRLSSDDGDSELAALLLRDLLSNQTDANES